MSDAPGLTMTSGTGKWWFLKEDGKVALVNNGDDLGTIEDVTESTFPGCLKIKLKFGPPWRLPINNFDTEANDFCGRFKHHGDSRRVFLGHWKKENVTSGSVPVEKPTTDGDDSSVTEPTATAPKESDDDVIERHLVGTFEIPVDGMVSPHWSRLCRQPDPDHVQDLKARFKATPGMAFTVMAVHLPGITPETFQPDKVKTYAYEVLGGNHTRLALQLLRQEQPDNSSFKTRMAKVYCGLTDSLAKRIGVLHNDGNFHLPSGFKEQLYNFRAAAYAAAGYTDEVSLTTVEPPRNSATVTKWKDGLCTMLGIVDTVTPKQTITKRKGLSNKYPVVIRLAVSSCRVWAAIGDFIARWEEGRIPGQPRTAGKRNEIKNHHLSFLKIKDSDEVQLEKLKKVMNGELDYRSSRKRQNKVTDPEDTGPKDTGTKNTGEDTDGDNSTKATSAGPEESKEKGKKKEDGSCGAQAELLAERARNLKLEAEIEKLKSEKGAVEDELKRVKDMLAEEETKRKILEGSLKATEDVTNGLIFSLETAKDKADLEGNNQTSNKRKNAADATTSSTRPKSRRTETGKTIYDVGQMVAVIGTANDDDDDPIPWFGRVVATKPLKVRWYDIDHGDNTYHVERDSDGKPLKDQEVAPKKVLTAVTFNADMSLSQDEHIRVFSMLPSKLG
ncbi:Hypp6766 [Branchiostoma lanceolatum]|uniref:Hypp6766 protein n=1 Tax=Branchiostoma lanceolatum TaxID=7740 RepID=A0A8K0EB47_BRALA|nr:Hypp6766 [Branchiostoma lanceolatum]